MNRNQDEQTRLATQKNALYRAESAEKECDALRGRVERLESRVKSLVCTTHLAKGDLGDNCVLCAHERLRTALDAAVEYIETAKDALMVANSPIAGMELNEILLEQLGEDMARFLPQARAALGWEGQ